MAAAQQQYLGDKKTPASTATARPPSQIHSIYSKAGGGERSYRIHVPENCSGSAPLILAFHGKDQNPSTFESETQLSDPHVNSGSIVVYPHGHKVKNVLPYMRRMLI